MIYSIRTFRAQCTMLAPLLLFACRGGESNEKKSPRTLTVGAYTTPREAYGRSILPAFALEWQRSAGESLRFET